MRRANFGCKWAASWDGPHQTHRSPMTIRSYVNRCKARVTSPKPRSAGPAWRRHHRALRLARSPAGASLGRRCALVARPLSHPRDTLVTQPRMAAAECIDAVVGPSAVVLRAETTDADD